jgi:hypothetical protein
MALHLACRQLPKQYSAVSYRNSKPHQLLAGLAVAISGLGGGRAAAKRRDLRASTDGPPREKYPLARMARPTRQPDL